MAASPPISNGWRWRVVWLLFFATMLNYMDRLALNNTSTYVLNEFEPDPEKQNALYSSILNAFGLSFALAQIGAGFLADRFRLRQLYLGALLLWSAAGFLTGLIPAGAIMTLLVCRAILGVGEAFNWPCAVGTVRRVIPRESRGLANGIFHSGASIGAILTPLLVQLIVVYYGGDWRWVFLVIGFLGLIWAVLWLRTTSGERGRIIDERPGPEPGEDQDRNSPFWRVLAMRTFWITLIVGCSVNVCWHFFNGWFVRYLNVDLKVAKVNEQWLLMGFFLAADVGSMFAGLMTRKWVGWGFTVETARKLVMFTNAGLCLLSGVAVRLAGRAGDYLPASVVDALGPNCLTLGLFFIVAMGAMGGFAVFFSLAQDVIGRHTASILGVAGCASWLFITTLNHFVGASADQAQTFVPWMIGIGFVPLIGAVAQLAWPTRRVP